MCILIEGCTAPLSLAGRPAGVSEEDWTQWGRHLKRLSLDGSPQARFSAVLRAKLGGLRVAHATSWECLDKKRGPLLLPLAPCLGEAGATAGGGRLQISWRAASVRSRWATSRSTANGR